MVSSALPQVNKARTRPGIEREALKHRTLFLIVLAVIPIVVFYFLLFTSLTGLPFNDDYKATLGFVLQFKQASGLHKLGPIFTHRHNEYLLVFQNAIYAVQYELLGRMYLKFLTVAGDLLVIPLFGTLWLLWSEYRLPRYYALVAFLPVSWILFQLQYASTLNCVMAPLQNIAVLIFTLAAFYFGTRNGGLSFVWAILFVVLSISASGGGLLVGPVLGLFYLQRQAWKRFAATFLISLSLGWLYLHVRYMHDPPPSVAATAAAVPVHHGLSLSYAAAFLGSIAAGSRPAPAIAFAVLLLATFAYATIDRLYEKNPGLFYSILFFFIQALSVAHLRAPRGLFTALGSRYRINSVVLVILLYFFVAEKMRGFPVPRRWRMVGATAAMVILLGFNLACDRAGDRLLHLRRLMVQQGVVRWEHHEVVPAQTSSQEPDYMEKNAREGMYDPPEPLLTKSLQAGIYVLPPPGPNR